MAQPHLKYFSPAATGRNIYGKLDVQTEVVGPNSSAALNVPDSQFVFYTHKLNCLWVLDFWLDKTLKYVAVETVMEQCSLFSDIFRPNELRK